MRGVILAAVCCLVGTVASAATVVVRAGEHDGFTRIVLQLPAEATWSLGHKADGYLLVTEGGDVGFDLAKTFEHIGRNRIAAIEATGTPGALMLKLACDCQAVASRTSAGLLVIDVADGSIGDAAKVQAPLDPAGAGKLSDLERFWLRRFSTEEMTPSDGSGTSEGPSPAETDQSRLETAARLLEWQVSRAMGQGLVEPSEVTPDAQLHPSAPGRADLRKRGRIRGGEKWRSRSGIAGHLAHRNRPRPGQGTTPLAMDGQHGRRRPLVRKCR